MTKYIKLNLYRKVVNVIALIFFVTLSSCHKNETTNTSLTNEPKPVAKTNAMQIYMHYMPWFQSKPVSGYWGSHWRMNTRNPDIDSSGYRQIASHYYPLIGPYDSNDKDVLEYHLLLMKYAGIDAVLIDWYGSHDVNDYQTNLIASNTLIAKIAEVGLKFAVVYEEYTAQSVQDQTSLTDIQAAQGDMSYLQKNYFSKAYHITIGNQPLLLTFGPRYFTQSNQWTEIFSKLTTKPVFLPLWFHASMTGNNTNGQFSWIDFTTGLTDLENFYNQTNIGVKMGSAYPRYNDYYVQGGWGTSNGYVDANNGQTFINTMNKAKDHNLTYLQLATWNDFGEGTVIEPTTQDQFSFLESLQQFTGVSYGHDELQLVYTYYQKKKQYASDSAAQQKLLDAYHHLTALEVDAAKALIDQLN